MIDTHAHLQTFSKKDQTAVIARAREAGVRKIVNAACSLLDMGDCLALADTYDFIWTTAGIHPTELTDNIERDLERVSEYAKNEKRVKAIGEIGLDYYHDRAPRDLQHAFLVGQLNIADQRGLPAILHCRGSKAPGENEIAFMDLIRILEKTGFKNAVAHCFSGNAIEAEKLLDLGLMLSFTGILTYPENDALRDIVKATPLDRIMLETDSPYLPPHAHRGQRNEPAFVVDVANAIAEIKGVPLHEVELITTRNAERFFGI